MSRTLLFGSPLRLQQDDWIMGIFITTAYTILVVMANIEAKAQSNLLPPGFDVHVLTSQEISDREYGSKIVIVVEQMQILVIWACKACLLLLYHRLTQSVATRSNIAIKLLAVYVALSFVVMEILYFTAWCRPFNQYWAVPTKSSQCSALIDHRIVNAVFNLSSDLIMLGIALPIFIRSMLPWKRKLILCGIFSLGIFVIMAAVLNKYYSFMKPYEPTWIFWYVRESSTAVLVANLPFTWTLLRKIFDLGAFDEQHPPPRTYHSSRSAGGRRSARVHNAQETYITNENPTDIQSPPSKGSRSLSLVGSICSRRGKESSGNTSKNSQYSGNPLLEEAIRPHNLNTDMDIERGLSTAGSSPTNLHTAPRPTSVSADGTGGYIRHPRQAHISASSNASTSPRAQATSPTHLKRNNHSETLSSGSESVDARTTSPTPTRASYETASLSRPMRSASTRVGGGGGGGRSAADRRKRATLT
jgi:hypothetical protein